MLEPAWPDGDMLMSGSLTNKLLTVLAVLLTGCAPLDLYRTRLLTPGGADSPGVDVTWLGTAGVLVSDGRTGILIDPYVSRSGMLKVLLGSALSPDRELVRQWVGRLGAGSIQAVVVSHSHFDHALDAPFFALETGALLMGSESTLNVGRGQACRKHSS